MTNQYAPPRMTLRDLCCDPAMRIWARGVMDDVLRAWFARGDTDQQIACRIGLSAEEVAAERKRVS